MFRNKLLDLTRSVSFFSNAWTEVKAYGVPTHKEKQVRLLGRKDREALRGIEYSHAWAMAYASRIHQAMR